MRITWAIEHKGSGSTTTPTAEGAANALTDAVRDAYEDVGAETLAYVLWSVVGPLRSALVTDGRYAVERGQEWSDGAAGIFVTLYPT